LYSNTRTLAADVKREVLNELRGGTYAQDPQFNRYSGYNDGPQGYWGDYPSYMASPTYQTIKDSVKDEVLAQIQMEQGEHMARMHGFDRALSDRRIQQMVDSRHRSIENMKADIRRDLLAIQGMEAARNKDPYIRQITNDIVREARYQGVPLQQVTQHLGHQSGLGSGILSPIMEVINKGQRRGLLCGIGMTLLGHISSPGVNSALWQFAPWRRACLWLTRQSPSLGGNGCLHHRHPRLIYANMALNHPRQRVINPQEGII